MFELYDYQLDAIERMHNGCILCGGVGTGKSRTSLGYFYIKECGGSIPDRNGGRFEERTHPRDLYIITTAKKRDSKEWVDECHLYRLEVEGIDYVVGPDESVGYGVKIDSWNNIKKYEKVHSAFFIFDEQRVVGRGNWVKSFLRIAKKNRWILLSATPGDTWSDYIPVFVANGFYRNRTEFNQRHVIYSPYANFPKVDRYVGTRELNMYRNMVLVTMNPVRVIEKEWRYIHCDYDKALYKSVMRDRFDPFDHVPIEETGKLLYLLRKVVNSDVSRIDAVLKVYSECNGRLIVFYNFDYELEMLKECCKEAGVPYSEWNGHCHQDYLRDSDRWIYLVQYSAGAEGWNCVDTDTILFYSMNYSYRATIQAAGRIDRINTKYEKLKYFVLKSSSSIDIAIARSLQDKKNFNESRWFKTHF